MAQLISNVLMQQKPMDAVERPMTLIEKLEQERKTHHNFMLQSPTLQDSAYYNGVTVGFMGAIGVVKQHSDWISADERLPENNVFVLVWLKSGYYEVLQRSEYEHPNEPSTFIWEKLCCNGYFTDWDITAWQPLPQPPSEVQDD